MVTWCVCQPVLLSKFVIPDSTLPALALDATIVVFYFTLWTNTDDKFLSELRLFKVCLVNKQNTFFFPPNKICPALWSTSLATEDTVPRSSFESITPGVTKRWTCRHFNVPPKIWIPVSDFFFFSSEAHSWFLIFCSILRMQTRFVWWSSPWRNSARYFPVLTSLSRNVSSVCRSVFTRKNSFRKKMLNYLEINLASLIYNTCVLVTRHHVTFKWPF